MPVWPSFVSVIVAAKLLLTVSIHVCGVGVPPWVELFWGHWVTVSLIRMRGAARLLLASTSCSQQGSDSSLLSMWCLPFLFHKRGEQKSPLPGKSVTYCQAGLCHMPICCLTSLNPAFLICLFKKKKGFTYLIYKNILSTWEVYVNIRQM